LLKTPICWRFFYASEIVENAAMMRNPGERDWTGQNILPQRQYIGDLFPKIRQYIGEYNENNDRILAIC